MFIMINYIMYFNFQKCVPNNFPVDINNQTPAGQSLLISSVGLNRIP